MKPLFIPLKTEFYEAFKSRTKDTEYRKGYGKKHRLQGVIVDFYSSVEPTMTADWKRCYPPRIPRQIAACIKIAVSQ
jgi:hypothetical protein